jgi:hypothetical protein
MIPTLRILTRKTKLRFGKWKDYTIQELIDLNKHRVLIDAYYKLTSINYIEDILIELRITENYRIEKPSSNKEVYYRFLNENGYQLDKTLGIGADVMKKKRKQLTKSQLQSYNQGHKAIGR